MCNSGRMKSALLPALMGALVISCTHAQRPHADIGWMEIELPERDLSIRQHPDKMPLTVFLHPNAKRWGPLVKSSCKWWNDRLGFNAFMYFGVVGEGSDLSRPIVGSLLVLGNRARSQPKTFWAADQYGNMRWAVFLVPTPSRLTSDLASPWGEYAVRHEMGHALGLDHDPDPESIMYPKLIEEHRDIQKRILKEDLQRLRKWYDGPIDDSERRIFPEEEPSEDKDKGRGIPISGKRTLTLRSETK